MADRTDTLLVEALRRGEPAAFDRAYGEHRARVYSFLARLSGRADIAQDLFQETFLKLARNANTLRPDTDLAAWLFTVARNEFLTYRRRAAARPAEAPTLDDDHPAYAAHAHDPERHTAAARELERLDAALATLPEAHREVLLLVAVEGLEADRACLVLGLRADALRQRLSRARAALAEQLDKLPAIALGGAAPSRYASPASGKS